MPSRAQTTAEVLGVSTSGDSPMSLINPSIWIDPVGGNDGNAGTQTSPFLTVGRAFEYLGNARWLGFCQINAKPGTETGVNNPQWHLPQTAGDAGTEPPLLVDTQPTDSGLGTVTATGGTAGVAGTVTFGTITTGLAMVANAFQGWRVVYSATTTTAALRSQNYPIAKNTAGGVLTIVGTQAAAPGATDTFVIQKPGWFFSYTGNLTIHGSGYQFGMVRGGLVCNNGSITLEGVHWHVQDTWVTGINTGGIIARAGGRLSTVSTVTFSQAVVPVVASGFFKGNSSSGGPLQASTASEFGFTRGVFQDAPVGGFGPSRINLTNSYHAGNSYARALYSGSVLSVSGAWLDGVTSAPLDAKDAFGAIGCKKGYLFVNLARVDNCVVGASGNGDAVTLVDCAGFDVSGLQGAGSAGKALRVGRGCSGLEDRGLNTCTATGADVVVGANAAVNWAALVAGMNNDVATGVLSQGAYLQSQ